MLELGQFNLQFAFKAAGSLRKYVKYQARPIYDPAFKDAFKVTFLSRRQVVIHKDELRTRVSDDLAKLFELPSPDQEPGIHGSQRRR